MLKNCLDYCDSKFPQPKKIANLNKITADFIKNNSLTQNSQTSLYGKVMIHLKDQKINTHNYNNDNYNYHQYIKKRLDFFEKIKK